MTRYFNAIVVGLCFFAASGASVQASIQVGDKIKLGDGPGSPGGIFRIDDLNDSPQWNFDSFCVELEEYVNFSTTYVVENIALQTNQGNRTLQSFTAWLYNSYLDQTLSGFNFASPDGPGRQHAAVCDLEEHGLQRRGDRVVLVRHVQSVVGGQRLGECL